MCRVTCREALRGIPGNPRTMTNTTFKTEALPHLPALRSYARLWARTSDAADDLLQDTLAAAIAAWTNYTPGTNCLAFLLRVMKSRLMLRAKMDLRFALAANLYAHEKYAPTGGSADECDHGCDLASRHLHRDAPRLSGEMVAALEQLPDANAELILRHAVVGQTLQEIADDMGIPLGTALSRRTRSKAALQRALAEVRS